MLKADHTERIRPSEALKHSYLAVDNSIDCPLGISNKSIADIKSKKAIYISGIMDASKKKSRKDNVDLDMEVEN